MEKETLMIDTVVEKWKFMRYLFDDKLKGKIDYDNSE